MKIKLDENIGRRGRELLLAAGHDVATVRQQGLGGVADERLFAIAPVRAGRLSRWTTISAKSYGFRPSRAREWLSWSPGRVPVFKLSWTV